MRELHIVPVARLAERPAEERWLICSVLPHACVAVIGGQPKTGKSFFGIDVATSVASGTPCLGRFPVERRGRSLIYLAEDALMDVRARVADLCLHRRLDLEALDLHVIAEPALRLDLEGDRDGLWAAVERLRPLVLLLDPLVRLHTTLDENNSRDVAGLLGFLRELQRAFDVSVLLVHHTAKGRCGRPGQALRGSGDLHAWLDVGAYLTWERERLRLTLEHRSAPAPEPVELTLTSRPDGSATHLEVCSGGPPPPPGKPPLAERVLEVVRGSEVPLRRYELRERLRVNNARLGEALSELEERGLVAKSPAGWLLVA
jgi:hypothetical protein